MSFEEITNDEYRRILMDRLESLGVNYDPEMSTFELRDLCLKSQVSVVVL